MSTSCFVSQKCEMDTHAEGAVSCSKLVGQCVYYILCHDIRLDDMWFRQQADHSPTDTGAKVEIFHSTFSLKINECYNEIMEQHHTHAELHTLTEHQSVNGQSHHYIPRWG